MTDFLLLAPFRSDDPWELLSRDSAELQRFDDLQTAAEHIGDEDSLWLVLPGDGAITRSLPLAMRSARDVARAASLALEDQLALADGELFVAFGPSRDGQRLIVGLPKERVKDALAELQTVGLEPDLVTVDHALLGPSEAGPRMWTRDAFQAVRLADGGFTAEPAFADAVFSDDERASAEVLDTGMLADAMDLEPPNFRRGPFTKRRPLPDFSAFRLAASLAVAATVVFFAGVLIEGNRYARQASVMRDAVEAEFRSTFPGTPIVDLERQIRSRTNNLSSDGSFLPLTAALAEVLLDRDDTQLTSLRYGVEGELAVEIRFQEFSGLEALRDDLGDMGIVAREGGDARREEDAYVTQLYLRGA
ncbi:MAG: type II secretion system protein GspL [Pseudomonadota bacterium]